MLNNLKFKPSDFAGKNIKALENTVKGQAEWLKNRFDNVAENIIATGVNAMVDELMNAGGAANIGTANGRTVQKELDRRDNPHAVTKAQVGLGSANNTGDADKPISRAQGVMNTALSSRIDTAVAAANAAVQTANAAATAVSGAQAAATEAIAIAKGVDGKATTALQNSNAAKVAADSALQLSKTASDTANTALEVANGIDNKASTAIATANNALTVSTDNAAEVQDALYTAGQAFTVAESAAKARDPTTGMTDTVQNVLNNIFYALMSPITVLEFDNLNLTAGNFDVKNLTAYEFDTRAKSILMGG